MGNRSLEDVLKEKLVNLEKEGAVINWKDIQLQISNRKNKKKISI